MKCNYWNFVFQKLCRDLVGLEISFLKIVLLFPLAKIFYCPFKIQGHNFEKIIPFSFLSLSWRPRCFKIFQNSSKGYNFFENNVVVIKIFFFSQHSFYHFKHTITITQFWGTIQIFIAQDFSFLTRQYNLVISLMNQK